MLLILPGLAIVLVFTIARRHGCGRRESCLFASLLGGVTVVTLTEGLSLFHGLTRANLSIGWSVVVVIAAAWLRRCQHVERPVVETVAPTRAPWAVCCVSACLALAAATLVIALLSPPNTWDAMTYHLPRVMHWMQQGSVSHYRTNILRQLYLNPGAEFMLLHLPALSDTDRFANVLQWLAMVGSAAGVSLMAREFGAKSTGQAATALFVMTLPMGLLQATSTQNDYVTTFWLVCAAWLLLRSGHVDPDIRWIIPSFGAAMGLALLTKATAYLFGAPLCLWFALRAGKTHGLRRAPAIATVCAILLALNTGHSIRNARCFGSILGPVDEVSAYRNESLSTATLASNVLRNLAIHANVFPLAVSEPLSVWLTGLHGRLGISPFDRRTTLSEGYLISDQRSHEDYAGCGFHLLLITAVLTAAILRRGEGRSGERGLALCVTAGAVLFCAYLKWQPWHVRLHLPLLVLGLAPAGLLMEHGGSFRWIGRVLCVLLFLMAIPPLMFNELRPLVGDGNVFTTDRISQRFAARKDRRAGHESAVAHIRSQPCRLVGLAWGDDDWEYPLWVLLNGPRVGPYRFVHWEVRNASFAAPVSLRSSDESQCVSILEGEGRRRREQADASPGD